MGIREKLITMRDLRDLLRPRMVQYTMDHAISYANWYATDPEQEFWTRLIRHWFPRCSKPIRFYSVFGPTRAVNEPFEGVRIFFNGENMQPAIHHESWKGRPEKALAWAKRMALYRDKVQWDTFDLVIGYDCSPANENILYFPLWLSRYVDPEKHGEERFAAFQKMEDVRHSATTDRRGAALIASHDFMGSRTMMCEALSETVPITYAGKWRNSSTALWDKYNNDKQRFLSQFRFNLCPENMDAAGYTTEKIFDAFAAGCIPVYMGSCGRPAEDVLNPEAYICLDPDGNNIKKIDEIRTLAEDDDKYRAFMEKPVFQEAAYSNIEEHFLSPLYARLKTILS